MAITLLDICQGNVSFEATSSLPVNVFLKLFFFHHKGY